MDGYALYCTICLEYGEGDEFWRRKVVKQGDYPNSKLSEKITMVVVLNCAEAKHLLCRGS